MLAPSGIVTDHPIYITDGQCRVVAIAPCIPLAMQRNGDWSLEDFDLCKELYRGKYSILYKAIDRQSGLTIALKLYRKRKLSILNRYQVEREIRIHIALDHDHVIKLYSAFEDEKNVYMVQEFAGSGDLFEELRRNGGLVKEKYAVRDVLAPFLNALCYLHAKNIVHRDIKPENLLLTSNKMIKVADFGLSVDCSSERPVTRAGTLDYMAPEVLICPDKKRPDENKDQTLLVYGPPVDAWAIGILAYELIVGAPPFEQESRSDTYDSIMYKEPRLPPGISSQAKSFILAALNKNAATRQTVFDLLKHPWVTQHARSHHLLDNRQQPAAVASFPSMHRLSRAGNQVSRSLSGVEDFEARLAAKMPSGPPNPSNLSHASSLQPNPTHHDQGLQPPASLHSISSASQTNNNSNGPQPSKSYTSAGSSSSRNHPSALLMAAGAHRSFAHPSSLHQSFEPDPADPDPYDNRDLLAEGLASQSSFSVLAGGGGGDGHDDDKGHISPKASTSTTSTSNSLYTSHPSLTPKRPPPISVNPNAAASNSNTLSSLLSPPPASSLGLRPYSPSLGPNPLLNPLLSPNPVARSFNSASNLILPLARPAPGSFMSPPTSGLSVNMARPSLPLSPGTPNGGGAGAATPLSAAAATRLMQRDPDSPTLLSSASSRGSFIYSFDRSGTQNQFSPFDPLDGQCSPTPSAQSSHRVLLGNAADLLRAESSAGSLDRQSSMSGMNCVELSRDHWASNFAGAGGGAGGGEGFSQPLGRSFKSATSLRSHFSMSGLPSQPGVPSSPFSAHQPARGVSFAPPDSPAYPNPSYSMKGSKSQVISPQASYSSNQRADEQGSSWDGCEEGLSRRADVVPLSALNRVGGLLSKVAGGLASVNSLGGLGRSFTMAKSNKVGGSGRAAEVISNGAIVHKIEQYVHSKGQQGRG